MNNKGGLGTQLLAGGWSTCVWIMSAMHRSGGKQLARMSSVYRCLLAGSLSMSARSAGDRFWKGALLQADREALFVAFKISIHGAAGSFTNS